MLSLAERGLKHTCSSCSTRFYDLNKSPAVCPQCKHKVPIKMRMPRKRKSRETVVEGSTLESIQSKVIKELKAKNVKWNF